MPKWLGGSPSAPVVRAGDGGPSLPVVAVSGVAYVIIFAIPLARETFLLDPSNVTLTATAIAIGFAGGRLKRKPVVDAGQVRR